MSPAVGSRKLQLRHLSDSGVVTRSAVLSQDSRFRVAGPQVIHETFEGETVLIDLDSGCYFSLTAGAPACWLRLAGGESCAEIAAGQGEAALGLVQNFAERLVAEGVLVADSSLAAPPAPAKAVDWLEPRLEKFTDMKDLLLLDPIHEVDAAGWPRAAARES